MRLPTALLLLPLSYAFALAPMGARTEDGLALSLSPDGHVTGLALDDRSLPALPSPGGFEAMDMQQAEPIEALLDGGFEARPCSWEMSGGAKRAPVARTGAAALCLMPAQGDAATARSEAVSVRPGVFYRVSAWVKMRDADKPPGIRLLQFSGDGEEVANLDIHPREFPVADASGTHDWAYMTKAFFIMWRARTARLDLSYDGEGEVRIDDVSLSEINRYTQPWTPFTGRTHRGDSGIEQQGVARELGLRLRARYRALEDRIEVSGKVSDTTGRDRAIQLRFRIPIDVRGAWWFDDARHQRRIAPGRTYQRLIENVSGYTVGPWAQRRRPASTGKCRLFSLFPFGAVGDESTGGIALAQPMSQPRVFRIQYAPGEGLDITYDFGLSSATRSPSCAKFGFAIYRFDPREGFRGALARYYELFPDSFTRRAQKDGLYGYFRAWLKLPNPEEFGMAFELGGHPDGKKYGSYTFIHPLGNECDIRGKEGAWETGEHPTREEVISVLRGALEDPDAAKDPWWQGKYGGRYSNWGGAPFLDSVLRSMNSGIFDDQGNYCIHHYSKNLPQVICNTDPEITSPNMNEGEWRYYIEPAFRLYDVDGVDFDNIGDGPVKAYTDNYRREHFACASIPLVFNYSSRRPTILNGFSQYEFVRQVWREMQRRGKLTSGNVTILPFLFHAGLMDKLGGEEGETFWGYYGTQFYPHGGYMAFRDYSRALVYHKPVATLCSQGFCVRHPESAKEMQRAEGILASSALTGTFANLQSGDMESFRELYKRYVPAVRRLSAAGWEPLTHATILGEAQLITDRDEDYGAYPASVLIERFGSLEMGNLHFAIYNTGEEKDECEVLVDLAALGMTTARAPTAREVLTDAAMDSQVVDGRSRIRCTLSEQGLAIISVE